MYQYNFNSMSTMVRISINHELFANDLMPIYKLFTSVEDKCSRFKSASELSLLNQQIGKEAEVSEELFTILNDALRFYEETDGVFNPGILTAIENSGYTKSIEYIRGKKLRIPSPLALVATKIRPLQLDEAKQTVVLQTGIDLGGIAKGWVIDQAAEILGKESYGFINVGGDIRIFGSLPRPLTIGIEDPFEPSTMISSIQASNGAVATSTSMKRRWQVDGINKHHLIDPFTGEPSNSGIVSSTVTAPTALEADVWAKVTLLLGEEQGKAWIPSKGAQAVLVNQSKEIWKGGEKYADT
jgi:thiamine biosynthesis lipoprotein